MPTTQEELAAKRERVEKLRDQLAAAEAQRVSRESEAQTDIEAAQLDAEEARLQGQLVAAKEAAKVGSVKSGTSGVLDTIKEDKARADAFAEAQEAARAASNAGNGDAKADNNETEKG